MTKVFFRTVIALAALLLFPLPAFAQMVGPAVTTNNVNLRMGAGSRFAVVRVLRPGEEVNISRCASNWCLVDAGRDRGWVAQAYLRRMIDRPVAPRPDFSAGQARACFYEQTNFRGASFCLLPGQSESNLGNWRDRIASVSIVGRSVSVDVCTSRNFRDCAELRRDTPVLASFLQDAIASVKVW